MFKREIVKNVGIKYVCNKIEQWSDCEEVCEYYENNTIDEYKKMIDGILKNKSIVIDSDAGYEEIHKELERRVEKRKIKDFEQKIRRIIMDVVDCKDALSDLIRFYNDFENTEEYQNVIELYKEILKIDDYAFVQKMRHKEGKNASSYTYYEIAQETGIKKAIEILDNK